MTKEEVEKKVKEILGKYLEKDIGSLNMQDNFVNDLNTDSLDAIEIVMLIEDEYDLTVPDNKAEELRTIQNVADYVWDTLNP